ncbi:MAG: undecaprenyl-phosphate glucose phosphotransferase [Flavobacteriia bacterium]|jgi:putative colanic acid biosynthesis UDP-glucose lipid carrier transferase|uniref:undecaprenyl-phosphate glucose phosphotransferase n=1 Tax=Flavobacterium sp. TaxID=239 RepID=UPI002973F3E0|nr:MAG: undecaprenyl-phosphate glucose phosphotransferase [Flavobacteriia bacterium]
MQKGRYSKYIRPISILIDLFLILGLIPLFFKGLDINLKFFAVYLVFIWIVVSFFLTFYNVYRFTTPVEILTKIAKQSVFFILFIIAFFPFNKDVIFSGKAIALYTVTLFSIIILIKSLLFYYLKKYRIVTGNNFRNAIIIGYTEEAIDLKRIFEERPDYGYRFKGYFTNKKNNENIAGKVDMVKSFSIKNNIDEIYCSLNELSNEKLKDLVEFGDENNIVVKFIPDSKAIFSKNLKIDYYELFPVLSLQKTPLHDPFIKNFKRIFDFIFSLLVVILVLSWLTPLMAFLIKLESRGPVFFKQSRPGIDEQEFLCYKYRSMQLNITTEKEASRNDPRVTRIGRFIRKTSIDELPQFFNVLLGDMSVVGPRPHLWSQNKTYGNKIKKYMVRHYVKPGITGLAQVKGCRGEIETDEDMINRIKFDVYYIENWSLLMDVKIIIQTVVNIFKGEEKAY